MCKHRMPRKQVTAAPVEQDPKTDAEQMTYIINEVSATEPVLMTDYEQANALTTPAVPKAKAKRAPSRSPSVPDPKVIDSEVVVTPPSDEVQVQVTLPVEEAKAEAKFKCPAFGKMMSQKTLRHSHGPNCVIQKSETWRMM